MSLQPNTLYYGDCLEWLPRFPLTRSAVAERLSWRLIN